MVGGPVLRGAQGAKMASRGFAEQFGVWFAQATWWAFPIDAE